MTKRAWPRRCGLQFCSERLIYAVMTVVQVGRTILGGEDRHVTPRFGEDMRGRHDHLFGVMMGMYI